MAFLTHPADDIRETVRRVDDATRTDMQAYTGCIAGALTRPEYETALRDAGLVDIKIVETHRVHDKAASAIVRARKPRRR